MRLDHPCTSYLRTQLSDIIFPLTLSTLALKQNTFRGIRSSKFRHVYGKGSRKENCYENVLITQKAHDTAACAVNPKFVAIAVEVAGGGAFIVLPLDKVCNATLPHYIIIIIIIIIITIMCLTVYMF